MHAIAISARGTGPAELDLPEPETGGGEVRVAVEAASVNGFDVAVAAGYVWDALPHEFPVVLGRDVAGTVDAVGEGVTGIAVGDRVTGAIPGVALGPVGTMAQQVVFAADRLAAVPDGVSSVQAAALGLAAASALDVVTALELGADDVVLVSGATGGVGTYLVQLAARSGARVIATAATEEGAALVRSLGAQETVDHTGDLAGAVRAVAPDGVTAVAHAAGDAAALGALLAPGGRLVSLMGADADAVGRDDVTVSGLLGDADADKLSTLLGDVEAGRLTVVVARTFALAQATDALAAFGAGKVGKVMVTVP
jgi:NADPH:quinone reductase-like Zn-dependent oxidoreductase